MFNQRRSERVHRHDFSLSPRKDSAYFDVVHAANQLEFDKLKANEELSMYTETESAITDSKDNEDEEMNVGEMKGYWERLMTPHNSPRKPIIRQTPINPIGVNACNMMLDFDSATKHIKQTNVIDLEVYKPIVEPVDICEPIQEEITEDAYSILDEYTVDKHDCEMIVSSVKRLLIDGEIIHEVEFKCSSISCSL